MSYSAISILCIKNFITTTYALFSSLQYSQPSAIFSGANGRWRQAPEFIWLPQHFENLNICGPPVYKHPWHCTSISLKETSVHFVEFYRAKSAGFIGDRSMYIGFNSSLCHLSKFAHVFCTNAVDLTWAFFLAAGCRRRSVVDPRSHIRTSRRLLLVHG